ncbi:hypothetical protein ACFSJW_07880 [Flavobacterium artemisiae]|uniref:Uncharacterized protein n=1 Tax=Flavobacterium artemisiae TaxID=2126556 RepID=A0ABW4HH48_9FLAO
MKKKFTLEIANPCSENFDQMIPNAGGSFCNSCAKNVIDLSRKTNSEVAKFISENKEKNICARLKATQLEEEFQYNETSKINNLKYAAVAASILFISNNVEGQEKAVIDVTVNCAKPAYAIGKVVTTQNKEEKISFFIKGKLLEAKTKKPFDKKTYWNLVININNSESAAKVNAKTGEFSIQVKVLKYSKTLTVTIMGNDHYLSKTIDFDIESVKNNVLLQNVIISSDDLGRIYIAGGLGINYIDKKKTREI